VRNYIRKASLGKPSKQKKKVILLIDRDRTRLIEFPNEFAQELDKMEFYVLRDQ